MGLSAQSALLRHLNGGYELIVTARNQIIIVGSKAFNLRNHKVRATVSFFFLLLLMKIKCYTLSLLIPSK